MTIFWTKRAFNNLKSLHSFLNEKWSEKTANNFSKKLGEFLITLKNNPEIGKIEVTDKGIRAFLLTRQNTIFYRIKKDKIIILQIFDNRMNPNKKIKL